MDLLRRMRDDGVCILFISHRMHEIEALADTCSVFRNGEHVSTFAIGTKTHDEIVQLMIGKPISQIYPGKPAKHRRSPLSRRSGLALGRPARKASACR